MYESGSQTECILNGTRNVQFMINSQSYIVELDAFPYRPEKTTRIEITTVYTNDDTITIRITDMGFGEFYKSSGKVIERIIDVNDYI